MATTDLNSQRLHCLTLDECPDSVEWCPEGGGDLFACGTYQLLEQDSESTPGHLMNRKGSVMIFSVAGEKLKEIANVQTEAILDCKWERQLGKGERQILCAADARGKATFYALSRTDHSLDKIGSSEVAHDGLLLSLDWSREMPLVCASDSNGCLSLVRLCVDGKASSERSWKAHDFEAWITAFNYWDNNVLFSGGDDCKFCAWDTRSETPIFKNSTHQAGVCSVQCNPNSEHQIATGSYDECIRLWDCRAVRRRPMCEISVGGGVWRIKWNHRRKDVILAACMFNGFSILECSEGSMSLPNSFNTETGSLAYGVDWCGKDGDAVAGCTFYDRKLGLWKVPSP